MIYHERSELHGLHSNDIIKTVRKKFTLENLVHDSILMKIGKQNITSLLLVGLTEENFTKILKSTRTTYVFLIRIDPILAGDRKLTISLSTQQEAIESYRQAYYEFKPLLQRSFTIVPAAIMNKQIDNKSLIRPYDQFHIDSLYVYVAPEYRQKGVMRKIYIASIDLLCLKFKMGVIKTLIHHYAAWRLFFKSPENPKPLCNPDNELITDIELEIRIEDCAFLTYKSIAARRIYLAWQDYKK